ncbi:hypothetical protein L9F63_001473, partial [Diploptera punctata]
MHCYSVLGKSLIKKKQKSFSKNSHLIPCISESKWQDIERLEERDNIILQIREEIVSKTLETVYERYLVKQLMKFTVHCSYRAWKKVMDVCYLQHDSYILDTTFEGDTDIEPCPPDSWMANTVKILKEIEPKIYEDTISHRSALPESDSAAVLQVPEKEVDENEDESGLPLKRGSDENLKLLKINLASNVEIQEAVADSGPLYTLKQLSPHRSFFVPS